MLAAAPAKEPANAPDKRKPGRQPSAVKAQAGEAQPAPAADTVDAAALARTRSLAGDVEQKAQLLSQLWREQEALQQRELDLGEQV